MYEEFKNLKTDTERWSWLMRNENESDAVVYLDNDDTFVMIDDESVHFDQSIGDMPGIWSLLAAVHIPADGV